LTLKKIFLSGLITDFLDAMADENKKQINSKKDILTIIIQA
jgi:hypothetical protein